MLAAKCSRPASRVTRPGRKPGRQAEVERAAHVGAPQGGQELHAGQRGERGGGLEHGRRRLRQRLAAEDDDEVAVAPVERVGRLLDGAAARRGAVAGQRVGELLGDRARFARRVAQHRGDVAFESGGPRCDLHDRHLELHRRVPHAQVQDGQLLLEVGREQDDHPRRGRCRRWWRAADRAPPRRGGRRRAGRRRCRCRARPWPGGPMRRRLRWCPARRRSPRPTAGRARRARGADPRPRRRAPRATTPRPARRRVAPSARGTRSSECTQPKP